MSKRKRRGMKTTCNRCIREIHDNTFVIAKKDGKTYHFHVRCFENEGRWE